MKHVLFLVLGLLIICFFGASSVVFDIIGFLGIKTMIILGLGLLAWIIGYMITKTLMKERTHD